MSQAADTAGDEQRACVHTPPGSRPAVTVAIVTAALVPAGALDTLQQMPLCTATARLAVEPGMRHAIAVLQTRLARRAAAVAPARAHGGRSHG